MLKTILIILAIIGACFFPKVELAPAGIGTNPIFLGTICQLYLFSATLCFIYKRRHLPFYGKLWHGISMFFMILLATLMGGYIKEKWKKKEYGTAFFSGLLPLLWIIDKIKKSNKQLNS